MRSPDTNSGSNTTPSGGEEPTGAAFVKITTTPNGPMVTASVPEKEASQMLETTEFVCGIAGTVISPYLMARALELADAGMPWQVRTALLALAAVLPAVCYWLSSRRHRS